MATNSFQTNVCKNFPTSTAAYCKDGIVTIWVVLRVGTLTTARDGDLDSFGSASSLLTARNLKCGTQDVLPVYAKPEPVVPPPRPQKPEGTSRPMVPGVWSGATCATTAKSEGCCCACLYRAG